MSEFQLSQIRQLFNTYDVDGDGVITADDFREIAKDDNIDPGEEHLKLVFTDLASNEKRILTFEEIVKIISVDIDPNSNIEQVHLALTNKKDEMRVMWVQFQQKPSVVLYGTAPGSYNNFVPGIESTYSVGTGWNGWIYDAVIANLTPNTTYYYKCGSKSANIWSQEFSFTTENYGSTHVFAVIGDTGSYIPFSHENMKLLAAENKEYNFNAVIHTGDLGYATVQVPAAGNAAKTKNEIEAIWDIFGILIQKVAAYVPFMIIPGNHDTLFDSTALISRYNMPGYRTKDTFWYSFDYGFVHFIMMSTEHNYATDSTQKKWLENDLIQANNNRTKTPFVILVAHKPMYSSIVDEYVSHHLGSHLQREIEPLMVKYSVDLYLCGHMHCYERTYPMIKENVISYGKEKNYYVNPNAPIHIDQGTGGVFPNLRLLQPAREWSASMSSDWGYGRMIVKATSIQYSFISSITGNIVDEFFLIKNLDQ